MFGRKKVAMIVAEFLGTGVLTLVVLAVQRSTIGIAYFVALAAGLTVAALSYVFASDSGAHFNPAITIGLWSVRKVKTVAAASYVVAQLLGAWAAYGVYTYFVNTSLQEIGGHYTARVLVAEAVGAFIFALVWAAVSAKKLSASLVGAGLTLGIIVAAVASIGFVNPAVALGARAWNIWGSMGWGTFVLGPVIGGVVGFNLYQLVFSEDSLWGTSARTAKVSAPARSTAAKAPAKRKPAAKKRK
jgi:aquaporin Z